MASFSLLFLFLLLLQFSLLFSSSLSLFSPSTNLLLTCGSPSPSTTLPDRRTFTSDTSSDLLIPSSKLSSSPLSNPNPNRNNSPLYQSARIFTKPSAYQLPLQSPGSHLLLRLHFLPFSHSLLSPSARFHVTASNFVLLFNLAFENLTSSSPLLKEFILPPSNSPTLTLSFVPANRHSLAFVNAIELVSLPDNLLPDHARLIDLYKLVDYSGISNYAMETVYRVNVGGPKITSFNDSLWRSWVTDREFLVSNLSSSTSVHFGGRVAYRKYYGASREVAPDYVYNSGRVSKGNMTWEFPVDSGYYYLVRLHFCDVVSLVLNQLYVNVYLNGLTAYENLDISKATGRVLASPYYLDLVTYVGEEDILRVGVGASKYSGGLLNGMEIMKMNNTVGSLDGENSIVFVVESVREVTLGAFFRTLLCGFAFVSLLLVVFILVMRWRAEKMDPLAWARLPVDVLDCELVKGTPLVSSKLGHF